LLIFRVAGEARLAFRRQVATVEVYWYPQEWFEGSISFLPLDSKKTVAE
jgi:hypothetical protein